jgi:hypothetical protein
MKIPPGCLANDSPQGESFMNKTFGIGDEYGTMYLP